MQGNLKGQLPFSFKICGRFNKDPNVVFAPPHKSCTAWIACNAVIDEDNISTLTLSLKHNNNNDENNNNKP